MILAIDPGPTQSAYMLLGELGYPERFNILPNDEMRALLQLTHAGIPVAIEMIASMGMAVGQSVFETCVHIGRFVEILGDQRVTFIKRHEVKTHVCANSRAKDANIRQALIDRFGGEKAIGTKKQPGPLYGVRSDVWAALAVAVTWRDRQTLPHCASPSLHAPAIKRNA